jgi:methyl-accepting chemotaxis protein
MTVKFISYVASTVVIVLTVLACLTVVGITHFFEFAGDRARFLAEELHTADGIRAQLFAYGHASDLVALKRDDASEAARLNAEGQLRRGIQDAHARATSDRGRALVDDVDRTTSAYLLARRTAETGRADLRQLVATTAPALQTAIDATSNLVHYDEAQLDAARRARRRVDTDGLVFGLVVGLLAVGGVIASKVMLDRLIRDPLLDLARCIGRFGHGDRAERAPARGALEIVETAESFNEMAQSLEDQHARMGTFLEGVAGDLLDPVGAVRAELEELLPDGRS